MIKTFTCPACGGHDLYVPAQQSRGGILKSFDTETKTPQIEGGWIIKTSTAPHCQCGWTQQLRGRSIQQWLEDFFGCSEIYNPNIAFKEWLSQFPLVEFDGKKWYKIKDREVSPERRRFCPKEEFYDYLRQTAYVRFFIDEKEGFWP